jgi:myo-inositol-1(or 4)-monophosphatase
MNLEHLCQDVISLSKEVGQFIRDENINTSDVEIKSKNSLVTYVDKTAEKRLVDGLSILIPEAGYIAEEGTSTKKGEVYNWIIDPLDGTTNFIHGLPIYCISIGLQRGDQIILGVIFEVTSSECFYAWENSKAYLNGKEISVSKTEDLSQSLVATGFPYYNYDRLEDYMRLLQHFMKESRGIRRLGSAAIDLAYVACGRMDGFYEYSLNAWDVAAGAFIVQQAGGQVCDFSGGDDYLFGREIIATNSGLFTEFSSIIKSHMSN